MSDDISDPSCRIECCSAPYRSGVIEVCVLQPGFVNLEFWSIDPAKIEPGRDIRSGGVPESAVIDNNELDLSLDEAQRLIALLSQAVERATA